MTIKIHVRVSDWEREAELANLISDKIIEILPTDDIPVYVIPVDEEDDNGRETLIKKTMEDYRKKYKK